MTDTPLQSDPRNQPSLDDGSRKFTDLPAGVATSRFASSQFVNVERRSQSEVIFQVGDVLFSSNMPRPSHWSVAWSDLMMTMFVLFLVMFVYQTANQEFLQKTRTEIIGGDTTEALQTLDSSGASFPFSPIHPGLPLMTAGKIKKIEPIHESLATLTENPPVKPPLPDEEAEVEPFQADPIDPPGVSEKVAIIVEPFKDSPPTLAATPIPGPDEDVIGPLPLVPGEKLIPPPDTFQKMYTLSKEALENNSLDKFASIDLVPDTTVRIILTGDLLFDLGESDLSRDARESLQKVAAIIRNTPYMINVVGHTDNTPMRSRRFISNWELSVARAGTVGRYLIDEIGMNPNQFVVSGYSSYRPILPNTTAENRAKNRRVEIIISKRLPNPLPATAENLP